VWISTETYVEGCCEGDLVEEERDEFPPCHFPIDDQVASIVQCHHL